MQGMQVQSLGWKDPLEREMATHPHILAWEIPWTRGARQATVHEVTKELDMSWQLNNNKVTCCKLYLVTILSQVNILSYYGFTCFLFTSWTWRHFQIFFILLLRWLLNFSLLLANNFCPANHDSFLMGGIWNALAKDWFKEKLSVGFISTSIRWHYFSNSLLLYHLPSKELCPSYNYFLLIRVIHD